ncbi:MAG TPA: HAD family hydrolase [Stellaceae bacterium]|nr:HAD family hydrolase [Stellaceae bacterium]
MSGRPAVFLDRDGTINVASVRDGKPHPPVSLAELVLVPGASAAIAALRQSGYCTIVVTNQPDVATGKQRREVVEAINQALMSRLMLDDIRVCYHVDADGCNCRKPKPGMLLAATRDWNIDLGRSFMIGDRWRDVEAGRAAGCRTLLIESGYGERRSEPDFSVASLVEGCNIILNMR